MGKMEWSIVSPAENKGMIWRGEKEGTLIIRCKTLEESGYLYKTGEKGIVRLPVSLLRYLLLIDNAKGLA